MSKIRTTQDIYDFCKLNAEVRTYADAESFRWHTRNLSDEKVSRKYHLIAKDFRVKSSQGYSYEVSRVGTFYFGAMQHALHEFLGVGRWPKCDEADRVEHFRTHIEYGTWKHLHGFEDSNNIRMYITSSITTDGVRVRVESFPMAEDGDSFSFIARSHRPYTTEGVVAEVKAYIEKHFLLPAGRYRDIQVAQMWTKEEFYQMYPRLKQALHEAAEAEHQRMLESYEEWEDDSYIEDFMEPMLRNDLGIEDAYELAEACELARKLDYAQQEKRNYQRIYSRQAV